MHEISVGFRDAIILFSSEDMATILVKANVDYESLTDIDAQRIIVLMGQLFRAFEEAFIQHEEGHLDKRSWAAILKCYVKVLGAPAVLKGWALRKGYMDEKFVEFVDALHLEDYEIR